MKYTLTEHQAKKLISADQIIESVGILNNIRPEAVQQLNESSKGKSKRKLIVQMEAIHVGRTANYTFYTEEGLKAGLESWTHPYNKPVLTHHKQHFGEPIGRILQAEFAESTISGRKGLIFTCEITDPDAIEKVLDGRYSTVSIGATTDKVTCNICGTDRTKEWCDHWKGEEYEGQTCHFIIGTTFGKEVSYVNVPADQDAQNFSVRVEDGDAEENGKKKSSKESATLQIFQIAEGLMQNVNMPEVNLYESASDDVKQLIDGLLNAEEGSAPQKMKYKLNESGQIVDEQGKVVNVEEMEQQLSEASQRISQLESDLAETQATLSNTVIEKSKVEAKLTESQSEINRLLEENSALIEKAHKTLAEKVVDMKLILRKSDVVGVTKEEAIAEHIKRSEESLLDTIKDLQVEMQNTNIVRGTVQNPGAGDSDKNPANAKKNDEQTMTIEEGINLFKGMFSRKR